ncbi:collagenase-like [Hyposmocoma kahamanoa]|uniref:collagenase-like n=1 Tax=Hyposmocoma kahamanoa TaxID=1477025 RepID=UPI000E6D9541|nr:collagenase-like [Hyposmocoma kahamanoa]
MKWIIFVCLFGLAMSKPTYEPINLYYHETIGIPKATAIKRSEESSDFSGNRIIGGSAAELMHDPWFGGLIITLRSGLISVCGSSLLSNTRVITAAHCWFDGRNVADNVLVVLSSLRLFTGGIRIPTSHAEIYPGYNPLNLNNNIAVLTIPYIAYTMHIRSIPLPSGPELNNHFNGAVATIPGYGRQTDLAGISMDQRLHRVELNVISNDVCQTFFSPSIVVASTLCTQNIGRGICDGDSGGPLVTRNMLIGVASFIPAAGCERNLPVGFSRVTSFAAWINSRL